jgi:L-cystine transport system permease protein
METFSLEYALKHFPQVLKGVPPMMLIAVIAMAAGTILGTVIALCRIYRVPVLHRLCMLYVSFVRGTPLIVQICVVFYGLPQLLEGLGDRWGWQMAPEMPPMAFALVAYTIYASAYLSEAIRGALDATDAGQMEAALSLGMSPFQALKRIVIPQAVVVALPNMGNIFINLVKGTSLAFAIRVVEVMAQAKIVAGDGYRYLEMYAVASVIYWVICWAFERLFAKLESVYGRHKTKVAY